ncbi:Calmodulin-binding receptor-like cytoplasmic kinase 2 [Ancistrocladus abbreviatus]
MVMAIKKFADGDAISALDPALERNAANNLVVEKILELAYICIAPRRRSRPSMRRCAEILWSIRKDYRELSASDVHSLPSPSAMSNVIIEE